MKQNKCAGGDRDWGHSIVYKLIECEVHMWSNNCFTDLAYIHFF